MLSTAKSLPSSAVALPQDGITTGTLLETLHDHAGKTLRFIYDGREVLPGYHVTEVKSGSFEALDCGANPESWRETFVQLWDVPSADGRGFMPVAKFLAIMRKVEKHVPFGRDAKLTFEVSDGASAIELFKAVAIDPEADTVRVSLIRRPSSCKPRDRWLAHEADASSTSACKTATAEQASCCP